MTFYSDQTLMKLFLEDVISAEQYCEFMTIEKLMEARSTHKRRIFDIRQLNNYQCEKNFRFDHNEIDRLVKVLGLPDELKTSYGHRYSGTEGLCILLRRLCYTARWFDMVYLFRRDETSLCRIFLQMIDFIFTRFQHLVQSTEHKWLQWEHLNQYARAIERRGGIMTDVVGIIDGTARTVCRPSFDQKLYYSGHRRKHCIKFQGVTMPSGLIAHLDGAYPGSRHDAAIYHLSGLSQKLQKYMPYGENQWFRLYGDQGYSNTRFVVSPYRGNLIAINKTFNDFMKIPRQSVEWSFGVISREWDFVNCSLHLKIYENEVEKIYFVAALLSNMRNCLRPNIVSSFFSVLPVTLEEYVRME